MSLVKTQDSNFARILENTIFYMCSRAILQQEEVVKMHGSFVLFFSRTVFAKLVVKWKWISLSCTFTYQILTSIFDLRFALLVSNQSENESYAHEIYMLCIHYIPKHFYRVVDGRYTHWIMSSCWCVVAATINIIWTTSNIQPLYM